MPNGAETLTTEELLDVNDNPEHTLYTAVKLELRSRLIKQGDSDDSTYYRGGIRPTHQPGNP